MDKISTKSIRLLIVLLGAMLYIPFIGDVHLFDWDEINFAESAREMLLTGNWRYVQINFQPFYEKPPFFIWLQAICMKIFGVSAFSARLPNAVFSILSLLMIQRIGEWLGGKRLSLIWVIFYASSCLPFAYAKSGIIDPVFNFFIFASLYQLFEAARFHDFEHHHSVTRGHRKHLFLCGLFLGIAVLSKGPVAILFVGSVFFIQLIWTKGKMRISFLDLLFLSLIVILVIGSWLSVEIKANGFRFLTAFFQYQIRLFTTPDAGHAQPIYFHWLVVLLGCFPASVFIFPAFSVNKGDTLELGQFKSWMITLLLLVLVIFSLVQTKIVHYSSLAYFPVTFLAAYQWERMSRLRLSVPQVVIIPGIFIMLLFSAAFITLPYLGRNPDLLLPYLKDPFARNCLTASVKWEWSHAFPGVIMLIGLFISFYYLSKNKSIELFWVFAATALLTWNWAYQSILPQIEGYSQNAYIGMLKDLKNKNAINARPIFVETAGFKSYAQLFYFDKQPPLSPEELNPEHIIWRDSLNEAYLIGKDPNIFNEKWLPACDTMDRKNGYVLLRVKK